MRRRKGDISSTANDDLLLRAADSLVVYVLRGVPQNARPEHIGQGVPPR
jgi:hypothetical protein